MRYIRKIQYCKPNIYMKDITCVMLHLMMWRLCLKTICFYQTVRPIADSRKGQQDAIKQVIAERQLEDKISEVSYSDCDDEKIKFLSGAGIIYGMDDGTFAPDDNITREQAAAILYRTAGFLGNKTIVEPNGTTFDDGKLISDWARESVSIMNSMKIMEGVSDTEFAPKGNYTVEQAIATMVRLYNCY